ncbi:hypothetical protein REPUB_Repub19eG0114200 [Reevesia pubescens]
MPGCYDAQSAAIVQQSGFSPGFISGYALSASVLGKPDFGYADTVGGNALNVQRTIKDWIAAGAAGCFLEDQAWPKKCGMTLKYIHFIFAN